MSKSRWLVAALICSLVALPTISNAQAADSTKEQAKDFMHDVMRALLGPNWNVFAQGGATRSGQYLLQHAANTVAGERALKTGVGYNFGIGGGVDFLLR